MKVASGALYGLPLLSSIGQTDKMRYCRWKRSFINRWRRGL
jgi:hypothetical protein